MDTQVSDLIIPAFINGEYPLTQKYALGTLDIPPFIEIVTFI